MALARLLPADALLLASDWRKPRFAYDADREEGVHDRVNVE